jgi:predicted  nucleic acid-binding Zn-ribbon protein
MDLITPLTNLVNESFLAVIFTAFAATATIFLERKKRRIGINSNSKSLELVEMAFEEVQKTVEELREQNEDLKKEHQRLRGELDLSREKYYHQVEINATTSAQLTKLNFEFAQLNKLKFESGGG